MPPLPTRERLRLLEAEMLDAEEQGAALLRLVGGTLARAKGVASSPCHFSWLEACAAYRAFTHAAAERLVSEVKQRESDDSRVAAEKALERDRVAADKVRVAAEKEALAAKAAEEKEARTKAEAVKAAAAAAKKEREEATLAKEKEVAVAAAAAEVARAAALKEKEREAVEAAALEAAAEAEEVRLAAQHAETESLGAAQILGNESVVEEGEEEEEEGDTALEGPPPPSFLSPASLPLSADDEEEEAGDISDGELAPKLNVALESGEEEHSVGSDLDLEALDVPIGSDFPSLPFTTALPTASAASNGADDEDDDPPLAEGMPNDPFLAAAWIAAKRRQGRKSGVFEGGASKAPLNASKAPVFDGSATSSILEATSSAAAPSTKAAAFEGGASRSFFGGSSRATVVKTGLQPMDAPTTILSSPPPTLPKSYMHDSPPIPIQAASIGEDTSAPHVDSPGQSMSLNDLGGKGQEEEEEEEEDGGGFSWPGALGGGLLGGFSLSHSIAPRPRASAAVTSKPAVPTPLAFRAQHRQAMNSLDSDEEDEDFGGAVFGGGGGGGGGVVVKAGGRDSPDTPDSAPPSPDMDKIEEFAFGSTWGGGGAKKVSQPNFQGGVASFTNAPSKAPPPPPPSKPSVSSWSTVGGEVDATDL